LSTLPVPCGSLAFKVCGTSGRRIMLMPMPLISCMVCWMVRPGARAAIRPERVADVLLHRRAARVGGVVRRLVTTLETEPVAAADREHRAVLRDAARGIHAPHRAAGVADREAHRVDVVLAPPLSVAVAVAECVPLARPVALKL
jgi:hypothetical protein